MDNMVKVCLLLKQVMRYIWPIACLPIDGLVQVNFNKYYS